MKTMLIALAALGMVARPPQDDLTKRLTEAYGRAADWLVSQQDASGAWKKGPADKAQPSLAYTGIMVTALADAPGGMRGTARESGRSPTDARSPRARAAAILASMSSGAGSGTSM